MDARRSADTGRLGGVLQMTTNPYAPPRASVRDIADPTMLSAPADRGTRLGATILDSAIFVAMVYVPMLIFALVGGAAGPATDDVASGALLAVIAVVTLVGFIVWCYFTVKYVKLNGQSIAKKILGIKVVRTDGSPASLGRAHLAAQCRERADQHHPALRTRRRALHLRGIAAVSARQDCGHHRRQSLRAPLSAQGRTGHGRLRRDARRHSARAASGRPERTLLRVAVSTG